MRRPLPPLRADEIEIDERVLREGSADQGVVVGIDDGHAVEGVAKGMGAGDIRADEVAAQRVELGTAGDQNAVAAIAGDDVAVGRLAGAVLPVKVVAVGVLPPMVFSRAPLLISMPLP